MNGYVHTLTEIASIKLQKLSLLFLRILSAFNLHTITATATATATVYTLLKANTNYGVMSVNEKEQ